MPAETNVIKMDSGKLSKMVLFAHHTLNLSDHQTIPVPIPIISLQFSLNVTGNGSIISLKVNGYYFHVPLPIIILHFPVKVTGNGSIISLKINGYPHFYTTKNFMLSSFSGVEAKPHFLYNKKMLRQGIISIQLQQNRFQASEMKNACRN